MLAGIDGIFDELDVDYATLSEASPSEGDTATSVVAYWSMLCLVTTWLIQTRNESRKPTISRTSRRVSTDLEARVERAAELMRTIAMTWPELDLIAPSDIHETVWTVRVSPAAYLRAVWSLLWSAIRHPLSDTTIDLCTGRVLRRS